MPGRTYNLNTYRYNYQGQENAVNINWQDFELRMHNSDLGRFMAPDPNGQFASPYISMANNPISGIDPTGGFANGLTPNMDFFYYVGGMWYWSNMGFDGAYKQSWKYQSAWADRYQQQLIALDMKYAWENGDVYSHRGDEHYQDELFALKAQYGIANVHAPNISHGDFGRIGDGGGFGDGAFSDVDAPRSETEARADAGLADVMNHDYSNTYDVTYFATQADYQNNSNGTDLGNHKTLDDAFAIGGAAAAVIGYVRNQQAQITNDVTAGPGGMANKNYAGDPTITDKTTRNITDNAGNKIDSYITALVHEGKSNMELVFDHSTELQISTVGHFGSTIFSYGVDGSWSYGTTYLSEGRDAQGWNTLDMSVPVGERGTSGYTISINPNNFNNNWNAIKNIPFFGPIIEGALEPIPY